MFKRFKNGGNFIVAFTLAEVLITISIIGIVAALTVPNFINDIKKKQYNSSATTFQRRLGEALNIMETQNVLRGHDATIGFINALSKNMKIAKVCTNVEDCFAKKFKKGSDAIVETKTLKDAKTLGQNYKTETVGVLFANGVRAIIAYNPNYSMQSTGNVASFSTNLANKTVSMRTNVLSMIYDISDDSVNKIGEDIFVMNTNLGSNASSCEADMVRDYCVKDLGTSYSAIPCTEGINQDYCGEYPSAETTDSWAGANKACSDLGMRLPTPNELKVLYGYSTTGEYDGILPRSGNYFSSEECGGRYSYSRYVNFENGYCDYNLESRKAGHINVLCVGN